jgi:hypothetical protein
MPNIRKMRAPQWMMTTLRRHHRSLRTPHLACALLLAGGTSAVAEPQKIVAFGHDFQIVRTDEFGEQQLIVDGKVLLEDLHVNIEAVAPTETGVVVIGRSDPGGNMCNSSVFIVHAAKKARPKLHGPLELCFPATWNMTDGVITVSTSAFPGNDGQNFTWTPQNGLVERPVTKHKPNPKLGWQELQRAKNVYLLDLFDYGPVAAALYALMAKETAEVLHIARGPASPGTIAQSFWLLRGSKDCASGTARSFTTERMKGWSMSACVSTLPFRCAGR